MSKKNAQELIAKFQAVTDDAIECALVMAKENEHHASMEGDLMTLGYWESIVESINHLKQ